MREIAPRSVVLSGIELASQVAAPVADDVIDNLELSLEDVGDFPHSQYSSSQIARAGKLIASDLEIANDQVPLDVRDAFLVANNWRDAHAYPMRSIRQSLQYHVKANDLDALTAARLKRMQAIRRKLRRIDMPLHKLQDLGGCRVILATIAETRALVSILKDKLPSVVIKESDYISKPKSDGYRSHHLVFKFSRPKKITPFDGKRIEVQVRTHLQHSWATAVETVGLFRGEELKNQKGDKDWLRFFALMSAEFAEAEKCATVPGTPDSDARKLEIAELEKSLDALAVLERIAIGFQGTDLPLTPGYKPSHFLIKFEHSTKTVHVQPYNRATNATASYDRAEEIQRAGDPNDAVVLVEVDKINDLKKAYPNYFGDVDLFRRQLAQIVRGGAAIEYKRPPRERQKKRPVESRGDISWLRGTRFPKPNTSKKKKRR